jgi:hypothetical protein
MSSQVEVSDNMVQKHERQQLPTTAASAGVATNNLFNIPLAGPRPTSIGSVSDGQSSATKASKVAGASIAAVDEPDLLGDAYKSLQPGNHNIPGHHNLLAACQGNFAQTSDAAGTAAKSDLLDKGGASRTYASHQMSVQQPTTPVQCLPTTAIITAPAKSARNQQDSSSIAGSAAGSITASNSQLTQPPGTDNGTCLATAANNAALHHFQAIHAKPADAAAVPAVPQEAEQSNMLLLPNTVRAAATAAATRAEEEGVGLPNGLWLQQSQSLSSARSLELSCLIPAASITSPQQLDSPSALSPPSVATTASLLFMGKPGAEPGANEMCAAAILTERQVQEHQKQEQIRMMAGLPVNGRASLNAKDAGYEQHAGARLTTAAAKVPSRQGSQLDNHPDASLVGRLTSCTNGEHGD